MKTLQSVASVGRQVLAVLVSVYGVLSATVAQLHLPPAVSAILTAFGPAILAIEHYVGDPSTGVSIDLQARIAELEKALGIGTPASQVVIPTPVVTPPVVPAPVAAASAPSATANPVA